MNIDLENYRSGFVTIVGKPNVGKSTLLNALIGEKLSIVTHKPQTTRMNVKGFYNRDNVQIIFVDTPGYLNPRYELHNKMIEYIDNSFLDIDIILCVFDVTDFPTEYDIQVMKRVEKKKAPKIAILNKCDLIDHSKLKEIRNKVDKTLFDNTIEVSALKKEGMETLTETLISLLPFNPPFYSPEELSDLPMRFFAQEVILEQIFLKYQQELPYATAVVVEKYKESENKINIEANIWLERKSQKPIFLGKNGEKVKAVRVGAEHAFYRLVGKRVKIDLWVKIKQNWRKKKNALKEFGYR